MSSVETYLEAAGTVDALVAQLPADAWYGPGLGDWDLRSLVGHTSRALVTVLTYLHRPADVLDLAAPEDYCLQTMHSDSPVDGAAVLERGRQAGRDLGAEPAERFHGLVDQVADELASADLTSVISTIGGGITVEAYLPTRTFELVAHGLDISAAAGLPLTFAPRVLDESCQLAARIAVRLGHGPALLAALTGRAPLPGGFNVVG